MFLTIRGRLTLWYVGLLAATLVAFSTFLYVNLFTSLNRQQDRQLDIEAAQTLGTLDLQAGLPKLSNIPDTFQFDSVLTLYDPTGQRVLSTYPPADRIPMGDDMLAQSAAGQKHLSTIVSAGRELRILSVPVRLQGRLVAILLVGRPRDTIHDALATLLTFLAIGIPSTILLAIAIGLFLASQALGPIDRMTRAAEKITAAQDLSQRIDAPPSNDEVGRLAATFDGMLGRLEAAFNRERQFTADASHELRTPLGLLTAQLDVTLQRPRTPAQYRTALESLRNHASRMAALLGQLLALARAEAGREQLDYEPIALGELAVLVVESMRLAASSRDVEIDSRVEHEVMVAGDQTALVRLCSNLVDNSLKYTQRGGRIDVSVARDNAWAVLKVADTGVGIPAAHLPHLFERFYRVDKARSRAEGGAGLGLAICKSIADAHKAEIIIESDGHSGTTSWVRFPLFGEDDGQPPTATV